MTGLVRGRVHAGHLIYACLGEENLNGWRPGGYFLIGDHQWELEKLTRLEQVLFGLCLQGWCMGQVLDNVCLWGGELEWLEA